MCVCDAVSLLIRRRRIGLAMVVYVRIDIRVKGDREREREVGGDGPLSRSLAHSRLVNRAAVFFSLRSSFKPFVPWPPLAKDQPTNQMETRSQKRAT